MCQRSSFHVSKIKFPCVKDQAYALVCVYAKNPKVSYLFESFVPFVERPIHVSKINVFMINIIMLLNKFAKGGPTSPMLARVRPFSLN